MRSRGGFELVRTSKTLHEIAAAVGVSYVSVHRWQRGEKRPTADRRQRMFELYRIDPAAWDEPAPASRATSTMPPPANGVAPEASPTTHVVASSSGPIGLAYELERRALEMIRSLDEGASTPLEKARVMNAIAQTLNLLAKLTGQFELGKKVMQLPAWKRIEHEIHMALSPYPEAAAALRDRMLAVQAELER
jgi:transcriptional regulator with XRE-family HTH domain